MSGKQWTASGAICFGLLGLAAIGSCTWRTEHKVETVHKIDAHIVLDIRQLKEEAAEIEDYVREDTNGGESEGAGEPLSRVWIEMAQREVARRSPWAWLSVSRAAYAKAPAIADQPEEKVSEEAKREAVEGRKKRAKQIDQALSDGHLGENDRGYIEVLLPKDFKDKKLRQAALDLAKAENKDRKTIYLELAQRHDGGAKALPQVEMVFAEQIRGKLKKGQKFQAPRDKKAYAAFKESKLGRTYPEAEAGQWVTKKTSPPKK